MLGCTAALSWMLHDRDGTVLDLGRRRRRPSAALRRAARERDKCRCRLYSSRKVSRQDGSTPTIGTPRAAASPRRSTRPAAIRRAWPTSPLDRLARPQQPALSNRTRHPASSRSSMAERPTAGSVKVVNESARKISSPWDTHLAGAGRRRNQRRRFCRWNRVVADHPAERGPVPGRGIRAEHQAVPRARQVQLLLHHPGLHPRHAPLGVDLDDPVHVPGQVHHDRVPRPSGRPGWSRRPAAAPARRTRRRWSARRPRRPPPGGRPPRSARSCTCWRRARRGAGCKSRTGPHHRPRGAALPRVLRPAGSEGQWPEERT